MRWGVIDAPRGSYMGRATGSRGGGSKTEVSVCAEPSSADSQNGNAGRSPKEARRRAGVAIQPCARPLLTGLPRVLFAKGSVRSSAFLTETDAHSEIDVTLSKQTTENFLTGARTAISASRKHISNRELTMRRASASRAMRGICFALSNREHVELEHAPTN
jgi:hypothetical protein